MTAPIVDELGNAEYDNTIGEHIMNSLEENDEGRYTVLRCSKATKIVEIRRTTTTTGR